MRSYAQQKVTVAYPYPHERSSRFSESLRALERYDWQHHRRLDHPAWRAANSSGANITNARNEIVAAWLEASDADWLWWIDTDMVFDGEEGRAGPDLLDRLVKAAHPEHRPIVGALCFSWQQGRYAAPTLYVLRDDGKIGRLYHYPDGQLVEVDATGTGCLLVHRSVFEKIRAERKGPEAYPWFQETGIGTLPVGEDITFCIRARACGYPVYVDTSIKVGHEKPIVIDHNVFAAQQQARLEPPAELVFVVVAGKDRHDLTYQLLDRLVGQADRVLLYDNGSSPPYTTEYPNVTVVEAAGWPLHRMWNDGLDQAEKLAAGRPYNVAVLNNDLIVGDGFLTRLARGLRAHDEHWVAYPNYWGLDLADDEIVATRPQAGQHQTMSGWAFMLRGETGLRFDEQFAWWYGDTDLEQQVHAAGKKVVCVGGTPVRHLEPMVSSKQPERLAQAREDEARFARKWLVDPASLWLARHPEYGR